MLGARRRRRNGRRRANLPNSILTDRAARTIQASSLAPMKRFLIGFCVGLALVYWYLHRGEEMSTNVRTWFGSSATKYRGDRHHDAAREVLGESERRP
jgi:hypothetical protein